MTPSEWDELARSNCFSNDKTLIVHYYYLIGFKPDLICAQLKILKGDLLSRMRELNLPLREEDKQRWGNM